MNVKCIQCGIAHNCSFCPNCGSPATLDINAPIYPKRKNILAIILAAALFVSWAFFFIYQYGGINDTVVTSDKPEMKAMSKSDDTEKENLTMAVGDILSSKDMEVHINNIEFTYNVLPDDTSGFYNHYEADKGVVFIHIDTDVKNLSKQKLDSGEILKVEANYNKGYLYQGYAVPEDPSTGFTYANITSIDPLKTLGVRFIISCPEEVAESDYPLYLTFQLNGTKDIYRYDMR